jgi:hypothetical protein
MRYKFLILAGIMVMALAFILAACGTTDGEPTLPPPTLEPLRTPAPEETPEPAPEETPPPGEPGDPAALQIPFHDMWIASPHADAASGSFTYWDQTDPQQLPIACARCHSTEGFMDFVGADGSTPGEVNQAPERGSIITCVACHNEQTIQLTSVVFPSGEEVTNLGHEAVCMQCHQGRASTVQVDAAIERAGMEDDIDAVNADLTFINIHYYAAAATIYGADAKGGYEYEGRSYDTRYEHVPGYDSCIGCHNPHTLEIRLDECAACHTGVASIEDLHNIRMAGSLADYDGDGNVTEGIRFEIEGLQEMLMEGIQAYAVEVAEVPIIYFSGGHPYFFIDTDGDGVLDDDEAVPANRYNAWTPRLLKAAYNYQTSRKDPGAYAHGPKYIIQLLHDSIEDLNTALSTPVDLGAARRNDPGHFQASATAFRYWDAQGIVPGDCAKCHTGTGLPQFLGEASRARDQVTGVNVGQPPTSALNCSTCHDDVSQFTIRQVNQVRFPSGAVLSFGEGDGNNLCINCHQGRVANQTVKDAIRRANVDEDSVSPTLTFQNPHYFAAGATLFGSEAAGAFQYEGREYNGRFLHVPSFSTCVQCHDAHALQVPVNTCAACHTGVTTVEELRTIRQGSPDVDFDGDGDATEGIGQEIDGMHSALIEAIMAYALENEETNAIVFHSAAFPYWYNDLNADGVANPDELTAANRYNTWTPRLLAAAYNYTWVAKDPGAYTHNGMYIIQVLYDSLEDIGWDVTNMNRPPLR